MSSAECLDDGIAGCEVADEVKNTVDLQGCTEIRAVPSESYPTIAAAIAKPPAGALGAIPKVVVRLAPGNYSEHVRLTWSLVLESAGDGSIATLNALGADGLQIEGPSTFCVLRRLHIQVEQGCNAITIASSSPLIEHCDLQGAGCAPTRGARAGVIVRGISSRPFVCSCRIWGHSGAGICVENEAAGFFRRNEITQCGCGFWLDGGADPLVWQNIACQNSGAGVVARASAAGQILGNVFQGNACGALVESDRQALVVLAYNAVCENSGAGYRQGKATKSKAAELGAFIFDNNVTNNGPGACLISMWPRYQARDSIELLAAIQAAPTDRPSILEVMPGIVHLQEQIVLDRPIMLIGFGEKGSALAVEFRCSNHTESVIRIVPGGENAVICRILIRGGPKPEDGQNAAACVRIEVGRPILLECQLEAAFSLDASDGLGSASSSSECSLQVVGPTTSALLIACAFHGAEDSGISLDQGAVAKFLRCELVRNCNGIFVGESALAILEECRVRDNSGFGAVVAPGSRVMMSHTSFEKNALGSVRMRNRTGGLVENMPFSLLNTCTHTFTAGTPALFVGSFVQAISWHNEFTWASECKVDGNDGAAIVVESDGHMAITCACRRDAPPSVDIADSGSLALLEVGVVKVTEDELDHTAPANVSMEFRHSDLAHLLPRGPEPPPMLLFRSSSDAARAGQIFTHRCANGSINSWRQEERRALYSLLAMLAKRAKCPDLLSVAGLGGPICSGEVVHLRTHTGRYVGVGPDGTVVCNTAERSSESEFFVIPHQRAGVLQRADAVTLEVASSGHDHSLLSVESSSGQVCASPPGHSACEQTIKIITRTNEDKVESGTLVFLRAIPSRKFLEASGEVVRASGTTTGTRQRFFIEKVPPPAVVPPPAEDQNLIMSDQAWLLRRGVQLSLVNRQNLAGLLSAPAAPAPELLAAFATVWESEWRAKTLSKKAKAQAAKDGYGPVASTSSNAGAESAAAASSTNDPNTAISTATSGYTAPATATAAAPMPAERESEALARIRRLVRGYSDRSPPAEKENGDMFVSAMRSFFADALQMSQLEANNVMRIVEAFAAALANDTGFLEAFTESMLPEDQRKTYRTPEEILFGLAYTTMMLNTDMHSQQVTNKTWDQRKFVAAGKDCGVKDALMTQIYKKVTENEL